MIVFESRYRVVEFFAEQELMRSVFLPDSFYLTEALFKEEETTLLELVSRLCPKKYLVNLRDMRFAASVGLQAWMLEHIYTPASHIGLKKIAYLTCEEFIPQLSAEQLIDDYGSGAIQNRFFDKEDEAMRWLLA